MAKEKIGFKAGLLIAELMLGVGIVSHHVIIKPYLMKRDYSPHAEKYSLRDWDVNDLVEGGISFDQAKPYLDEGLDSIRINNLVENDISLESFTTYRDVLNIPKSRQDDFDLYYLVHDKVPLEFAKKYNDMGIKLRDIYFLQWNKSKQHYLDECAAVGIKELDKVFDNYDILMKKNTDAKFLKKCIDEGISIYRTGYLSAIGRTPAFIDSIKEKNLPVDKVLSEAYVNNCCLTPETVRDAFTIAKDKKELKQLLD